MNKRNSQYNYLNLLSMIYLVFFLAAAILAHKLVHFGNYMTSVSTFVLPFTFVLTDVVTEVYGYAAARRLIWSALFCEFLFTTIMLIAVQVHSPNVIDNADAYKIVFGTFMRIFIGNFIAMVSSTFLNIYALAKWKVLLKGKYFWLRSLGASSVGEFVFTFVCVLIAFIGVIPVHNIPQLIITSFLFKALFNPLTVVPATILMLILKKKEDIDPNDETIDFNPFKLTNAHAAN